MKPLFAGLSLTRGSAVLSVVAMTVLLASCSQAPSEVPESSASGGESSQSEGGTAEGETVAFEQVPLSEAKEAPAVIKATRKLGLEVLAASPKETLVTSPASAVIALSMLATTADGEAEDQFSSVLGAASEERDRAANALMGSLEQYRTPISKLDVKEPPAEPQVHLANQLVMQDGFNVEQPFLDGLVRWFDANVTQADLSTEDGKKVLDEWVEQNTAGLIKKSAIEPSDDLRLVLQNATVFAAQWQSQFDPELTAEEDFQMADGTVVKSPFMNQTLFAQYSEVDGWRMLELPYGEEGNLVARYVLAPDGVAPASVTSEIVTKLEEALTEHNVLVSIPKLDLTSETDLVRPLQRMGLTSVFTTPPPSLEYLSKGSELVVSDVVQQGRFQVDEAGTVAAAVTEVGVAVTSAPVEPPISFIADRPHLVFLLDKTVGWDLFQVLVNDPKAA